MDLYLEDLNRKRQEAQSRMQEIVTTAEAEKRELSAEENANLEKWDADFDRYRAEEKRITDMRDKLGPAVQRLAESVERVQHTEPDFDFSRFIGSVDDKEHRGINTLRTIPVGAFSPDPRIREIQEREAARFSEQFSARALQSQGGSAVETSFADFVTVYERTLNPVIDVATVLQTVSGSPIVLPRLTADAGVASGTVTAEAAGITVGDATISQVTIGAWKRAYIQRWSAELDQDEVIGLEGLLAASIGRQVGLAWGTAFTTGNDTNEANGYLNAIGTVAQLGTANGTTGNTANDTFFAPADLIDAFYALAAPYRANASWLVSNTALAKMAKFRSTTGEFLYAAAQVSGTPDTFLKRPVFENPAMAAVASATISVSVGDFSKYIVREVVPARIDRSVEFYYGTDEIALRYILRRDGDLPDTTAIRAIRNANT